MKHRIEHPIKGKEDAQIEEIVLYMLESGQYIYNPIIFLHAWNEGKLKIHTAREDGKIVAMQIVLHVECPVRDKTHYITAFKAGEDISDFVQKTQ